MRLGWDRKFRSSESSWFRFFELGLDCFVHRYYVVGKGSIYYIEVIGLLQSIPGLYFIRNWEFYVFYRQGKVKICFSLFFELHWTCTVTDADPKVDAMIGVIKRYFFDLFYGLVLGMVLIRRGFTWFQKWIGHFQSDKNLAHLGHAKFDNIG